MGLWQRLTGKAPEQRAVDTGSFARAFGIPLAGRQYVNPHLAEGLATVTACINAVASTLAAQPAYVYRRSEAGRVEAPNHPVARLIRQPNQLGQTWADWLECMVGQCLAWGSAISVVEHDGAGRVTGLVPVPWQNVQPVWLNSGRLAFDVVRTMAPWGGQYQQRRLMADEVFWLKDRSDDGLIPRSRISRSPGTIGNALALQDYSLSQWENGATPAGVLQIPGRVTPEHLASLREQFEQRHSGTGNARRTLILTDDMKWQTVSISPEDAEVLASHRYSREQIAALFGVPAPVVGINDHSSFTNAETLLRFFAQQTLSYWCVKVQQEFARSVFGAGSSEFSLEISLDGLLKGDPQQRWASWEIALRNGVLDAEEVRDAEGWNPRKTTPVPPPPQEPILG